MKLVNRQRSIVNCCITMSFVLFILSFPLDAYALRMTNSQYIIQSEINSFSGKATGTGGTITFSGGQNSPGTYSGPNYTVRSGFQHLNPIIPFTFSISDTEVNFGTLVPGEPVIRETTLTVSQGSLGYQVTVQENHPLRESSTSAEIPDTTCDAGDCSDAKSGLWTSPLTYGFGYRCENVIQADCSPDFSNKNYYKQFARQDASEAAQVVMKNISAGKKRQSKIIYKVNIAGNQSPGVYQNIIKYIAIPSI